jgi:uncharacterized protein with ParB-like and HNH nuclease domain
MSRFLSTLVNVAFFGDQRFLIPSYQRPYVWGDPQIKKLLKDFWDAFVRNDEVYYLGTVVTSKNGDEEELIDGQQRFTTLWLIALAFERLGVRSALSPFLLVNGQIRLTFEIRTEVQSYLSSLIGNPDGGGLFPVPAELNDEQPYLSGISQAAEIIYKYIPQYFQDEEGKGKSPADFAQFIATRVMFVKNTAPPLSDLKKLFTTLNNSGIQLEQADILKSKLLKRIITEKLTYSKIWESCENMDNYFEQNVKAAFPKSNLLSPGQFAVYKSELFHTAEDGADYTLNDEKVRLADILNKPDEPQKENKVKTTDGREAPCESVINFPQLLLHTLRIFLQKKGLTDFERPFHSNNLLEIFGSMTEAEEVTVKDFFLLLWEVRYVFDKYVVKWVEKNGERILAFKPLKQDLFRGPVAEKSEQSMLQSMLYFTGNYNTQLWLSPYLKQLLEGKTTVRSLEYIDDYLSLSFLNDRLTTWNLMAGVLQTDSFDYAGYLMGDLSTKFKHYWFYKLEYVLWKTWDNRQDSQFIEYRITSKNSIEHIGSQNDEFGSKLFNETGDFLGDTFGNLTLLSVGQNSGYGNQDTGKKYIDHSKKPTYDSLKLARFFQLSKEYVTPENVENHRSEMIRLLDEHYGNLLQQIEMPMETALITEEEDED